MSLAMATKICPGQLITKPRCSYVLGQLCFQSINIVIRASKFHVIKHCHLSVEALLIDKPHSSVFFPWFNLMNIAIDKIFLTVFTLTKFSKRHSHAGYWYLLPPYQDHCDLLKKTEKLLPSVDSPRQLHHNKNKKMYCTRPSRFCLDQVCHES